MSPHQYQKVALAFREGGFVTVYEADEFLRLARGTTRRAVTDGRLVARADGRGDAGKRLVVRTLDVQQLLGVPAKQSSEG